VRGCAISSKRSFALSNDLGKVMTSEGRQDTREPALRPSLSEDPTLPARRRLPHCYFRHAGLWGSNDVPRWPKDDAEAFPRDANAAEEARATITEYVRPLWGQSPGARTQGKLDDWPVVIVLNHTLPWFAPEIMRTRAGMCVADGGANRLHDDLPGLVRSLCPYMLEPDTTDAEILCMPELRPDLIIGDLDSIRPDVRQFYSSLGVEVVDLAEDQDSTDLMKALRWLTGAGHVLPATTQVIILGGLGGRLDHTMGNLNALYQYGGVVPGGISLVSEHSAAILLQPGLSHILVNRAVEGPGCGLIPLGAPVECCTTRGLQWDLSDAPMQFGGMVSTSNAFTSPVIAIHTDAPLLWTTNLKSRDEWKWDTTAS